MESEFLALFDGQRGWERNPHTYTPRDDGAHIADTDDHWEWWYFDFSFDNGYKAVATLHYHNVFLMPHTPTMQLFVYPPQGAPRFKLWAVRPGQENSAAADRCRVNMGGLRAEDTGDGYHLVMDMKDLGLDVHIDNDLPGWKAGSGLLWTDGQAETGWVVAVPRGRVRGSLTVDGQPMAVTGMAYHDHNWGTFEMEEQFWGWYWGRIFDPTYTLIYGWVMPRDAEMPVVSPFMLGKGSEILLGTDQITVAVEECRRDELHGWDIPQRLRLQCQGPGVRVDGLLTTGRVVEALQLPRGPNTYHYYRFLAGYEADIEIDGQRDRVSGETLHEMMILE
ncbi:MAG: lipocalin-like domain-containing protein [Chloroflexota bacterium]